MPTEPPHALKTSRPASPNQPRVQSHHSLHRSTSIKFNVSDQRGRANDLQADEKTDHPSLWSSAFILMT